MIIIEICQAISFEFIHNKIVHCPLSTNKSTILNFQVDLPKTINSIIQLNGTHSLISNIQTAHYDVYYANNLKFNWKLSLHNDEKDREYCIIFVNVHVHRLHRIYCDFVVNFFFRIIMDSKMNVYPKSKSAVEIQRLQLLLCNIMFYLFKFINLFR